MQDVLAYSLNESMFEYRGNGLKVTSSLFVQYIQLKVICTLCISLFPRMKKYLQHYSVTICTQISTAKLCSLESCDGFQHFSVL